MTNLFKPKVDQGAAVANVKQSAALAAEKEDVQQQEARRAAAQKRARFGQAGFRSLLTKGFRGIKGEQDTLG